MAENLTTRHGESRRKRKNLARCYGQDLMRGEHVVGRRANAAIPGGGTGRNSAYLFRTPEGYAAGEDAQAFGTGTSVFDPVLCEIVYSWFCRRGGAILDPFAGGSVRGIVAARMGYVYTGIDLSRRQIEANQQQAAEIVPQHCPNWIVGDSAYVRDLASGPFDLVFTCPPYADLEVYSDDPHDLSNMPYDSFLAAYRKIIADCCALLAADRFACVVVGEVRDRKGVYRNLVGETIAAFTSAGMKYYNEAILITAVGSLPIRVGKQFQAARKLGKTHQNVLFFVKGNPRKATEACGDIELTELGAA